jgi:hypothetical protein
MSKLNDPVTGRFLKTHGQSRAINGNPTLEYRSWQQMMNRCYNPNDSHFSEWGGRGILVCDKWQEFTNFFADMGKRPSARHSLGRIDNDKGYSPDNCRWETPPQQARNTRQTRLTIAKAREIRMQFKRGYSCRELGEEFGVARQTVSNVVFGKNWKEEDV